MKIRIGNLILETAQVVSVEHGEKEATTDNTKVKFTQVFTTAISGGDSDSSSNLFYSFYGDEAVKVWEFFQMDSLIISETNTSWLQALKLEREK